MFNDLILDKMKKVFEYIATLLLLLAVGTSCEEGNDNWKVITAVPTRSEEHTSELQSH